MESCLGMLEERISWGGDVFSGDAVVDTLRTCSSFAVQKISAFELETLEAGAKVPALGPPEVFIPLPFPRKAVGVSTALDFIPLPIRGSADAHPSSVLWLGGDFLAFSRRFNR
jgi:hypothetical protein